MTNAEQNELAAKVWRDPSIEGYRELLRAGIDLNSVTRLHGLTLLMSAVAPRYTDTVLLEFLLEHGADPNAVDRHGNSALMHAATGREVEKLRLLLKAGANPNLVNARGDFALAGATTRNHLAHVKLLLEGGANPNLTDRTGRTALHLAAQGDYEQIVNLLLDHGANIEAQDGEGNTPLALATLNQAPAAAGALRLRGADRTRDFGDDDPWTNAFAASMNALGHGSPGMFFHEGEYGRTICTDEQTGLPVRYAGVISSRLTRCWVDGHNDGVREHIRIHGLPWNSRLTWMEDIVHWHERRDRYLQTTLHADGPPVIAPDGVTKLYLRSPENSWTCANPLILESPKLWPEIPPRCIHDFESFTMHSPTDDSLRPSLGMKWSKQARSRDVTYWGDPKAVNAVEVFWGPPRSELAFFRELQPGYDPKKMRFTDTILDLILGQWMSFVPGGNWEHKMKQSR